MVRGHSYGGSAVRKSMKRPFRSHTVVLSFPHVHFRDGSGTGFLCGHSAAFMRLFPVMVTSCQFVCVVGGGGVCCVFLVLSAVS